VDLKPALSFVRSKGNAVERARLKYLLDEEAASPDVVSVLLAGQRPDGGWAPFWATDYSSLDATCFRLAQAEQLGVTHSERAIAKAADFLAERQHPDGSWEEDECVASVAPSWAVPGNSASRLYLTANCGFWLAILTGANEATLAAAGHLQTHLDLTESLSAYWQAYWLTGGLWYCLSWRDLANQVFSRLNQQLPDLPASNLTWLIVTLLRAGVPSDHALVRGAVSFLEDSQGSDGRWRSEDGPGWDVHSTVEALRALRLCGRF
jgi:hypothetical protein